MNRQWGDLANKLGTMVEDLVYPSLPRILRDTLGREIRDLGCAANGGWPTAG